MSGSSQISVTGGLGPDYVGSSRFRFKFSRSVALRTKLETMHAPPQGASRDRATALGETRSPWFAVVSLAIMVFAIALSVMSAADVDLVPRLRRLFAVERVAAGNVVSDPARGPIALAVPDGSVDLLSFDVDFTTGPGGSFPNLLQTAPSNDGLRIESDGSRIAAVIADKAQPNGLFGITLARDVRAGQHYRLKLDYMAGSSSRIAIRQGDGDWHTFAFTVKQIDISQPMFGVGFAPERRWTGAARLRSYKAAQTLSVWQAEMVLGVLWAAGSMLLVATIALIWAPMAASRAQGAFAGLDLFRTPPTPGRGDAGDTLSIFRLLAFLAVALGHGVGTFGPQALADTLRDFPGAGLILGCPWGGIWMFFVLSGYLMGKGFWGFRYGLDGAGVLAFLNNRLVKILPAYIAVFLFYGLLRKPEIFLPQNLFVLFRIVTFNYTAQFDCRPLGSFWSISTEFQFYMIAPVLTLLILNASKTFAGFVATVATIVLSGLALRYAIFAQLGWDGWSAYIYAPLYGNLDLFGLGIVAAAASRFLPHVKVTRRLVAWGGVALTFATFAVAAALYARGAVFGEMGSPTNWTLWLGPTFIGALSLIAIAVVEWGHACGGSRMPKAAARTIAFLGVLTYPLYLWYEPVLGSLGGVLSVHGDLFAIVPSLLATIAITFVFAYFTYVMIERPAMQWRRTGGGHRPRAAAAERSTAGVNSSKIGVAAPAS